MSFQTFSSVNYGVTMIVYLFSNIFVIFDLQPISLGNYKTLETLSQQKFTPVRAFDVFVSTAAIFLVSRPESAQ